MKKRLKKHYIFGFKLFLFFWIFTVGGVLLFKQYMYIQSSPYDVIVSDIDSSSVTISWKTLRDVKTFLLVEDERLLGDGDLEKHHMVKIQDLDQLTEYSFLITDGRRVWENSFIQDTEAISPYTLDIFSFVTSGKNDEIQLPSEDHITVLPNELVYAVLYEKESGEYSGIRTEYANRYGGVVFDKEMFGVEDTEKYTVKNINYFSHYYDTQALVSKVFSSEINCNQSIPNMTSNAISRDAYTDLATRWVSGRGKNYAYECYNDTIYRAKVEGVDPAFALTIWLNESGSSNYTFNPDLVGLIEDFGIHGQSSAPPEDFNAQIAYFLKLDHKYTCEGLTAWEAWGNYYKWGSCNEDDPIRREDGIEYYKQIEMVYGWVTNGLKLPDVVTGLPKMEPIEEEEELVNPICCAIKLSNSESFRGDFENITSNETCSELWSTGRNVFDSTVEYAIEIPNKDSRESCEILYEGACCKLSNGIKWYPKTLCSDILTEVKDAKSCNEYGSEKACFLRDGRYQWLSILIGQDYVKDATSQQTCLAMNEVQSVTFDLEKGINFIGLDILPLHMGQDLMASDLMKMYSDIYMIADFRNNRWENIIVKDENIPYSGKDFKFEQNRGYLIITEKEMSIELDGWSDPNLSYLPINTGWNLVGGWVYTKSGKASTLFSDLRNSDIDINVISIWSSPLSSFISRVENEEIYGEDFALEENSAVFVK